MDPPKPTDEEAQRARRLAEQAQEIVEQAKKAQAKPKFLGFVFGKGNLGAEDAADLYKRAGKLYLEARLYDASGKAYEDAATAIETGKSSTSLSDGDQRDTARTRQDAFNAYRHTNFEAAMRCMNLALETLRVYGDAKSFGTAAETAAKFLEDREDRQRAIVLYSETARRYEEDGKWDANAAKYYDTAADLLALEGDFFNAVANYEKAARLHLTGKYPNPYRVREIWFKAGLCGLATGDLVTAQRNVQTYRQGDPEFERTRQCQLLLDLIEAIEAGDHEAFSQKLFEYDKVKKLGDWEAEILVKIKSQISEADNEFA